MDWRIQILDILLSSSLAGSIVLNSSADVQRLLPGDVTRRALFGCRMTVDLINRSI